jgi:tryptophanase
LWFDGCRINENAYFIKKYEDSYADVDVRDILKQIFSFADGYHISLKKILCSMGGFMQLGPAMLKKFPDLNKMLKVR